MKKNIYLLILIAFGLIFSANQNVFGQFQRMEIKYTVEEIVIEGKLLYNLEITVNDQTDKLVYSLYKDAPTPDNLIEESKPIKKNTYRFEKLSSGSYSIKVFESAKKGGFESIDLGNKNTEL